MTSIPKRVLRIGLSVAAAGTILAAAGAWRSGPGAAAVRDQPGGPTQPPQSATLPLTVAETEGPYFKTSSPERTSLVDDTTQGTVLTITGQVLAPDGTPIANALLDFWQANPSGAYDNSGYNLRGHQYADANGYYTLTTVVPGLYPGRTRHIHVKVQAPNGPVFTTQLFFPGEARNSTDGFFDPSLVLNTQTNADGTSESAAFNFVVNAV